ncbi:MAG TPA: cytochrome b/b6 domain-containing protein, partial [Steroidobacteraceae bacterium]|nr:cytochrome b/b6 domain-containing protein [Steroidobacteraceae bacterium]
PLGALSVVAMLLLLLVQASTGLFANDEIANAGPLYGWVGQDTSNRLTGWHGANSELLLAMFTLHIAAVGWYALGRRQGLLRAMLTGRKPAALVPAEESISNSRSWLAVLIVLGLSAALALAIWTAPEASIALF